MEKENPTEDFIRIVAIRVTDIDEIGATFEIIERVVPLSEVLKKQDWVCDEDGVTFATFTSDNELIQIFADLAMDKPIDIKKSQK